ncbi:winged helix DNA-binding protein [Rhizobium sp. SL86]|uniref:winged helix DNA-binding protein n=1 Tax=Rhizobium sp. SL86 TaxID=2995148 RepID=UPI002275BD88|nr:winged helix DNA-binding protein [Rhizobium sp. SL86]MCY1667517.1 winged helix DNA-binding protein [Rhizobium sp. SL86]
MTSPDSPTAEFDPDGAGKEMALTDFEWSLWRVSSAFLRWQSECASVLAGATLSGHDTAVLHTIKYRDRPKGLSEISRLLGRDDTANVQYAIKKLLVLKLIERVSGRSRKETIYTLSQKGLQLTKEYRRLRKELLVTSVGKLKDVEGALKASAEMLELLSSFYDTASRRASTSHQATAKP